MTTQTPNKANKVNKVTDDTTLRPKRMRRVTMLEFVGALAVAAGAVLIARETFGLESLIGLVVVGYLGFVATIALVEMIGLPNDEVIDLEAEESPAPALQAVPDTDDEIPDRPVRRRKVKGEDVAEYVVAAIGAIAAAELVRVFLHMDSLLGVFVWAYVAFLALYFVLARDRLSAEAAIDRVVSVFVWSVGFIVAAVLVWMVTFVVVKGLRALSWSFFTQDLSKVGPLNSGGGAKHAIIGTIEQVAIATIAVIPIGILTAVYLHEINGRLAKPVRFIVDAMAGLPSIVAGLLIYTVWVSKYGYSGLAGAFALSILMLPTMTRASEEILRTVPDPLREGALALGAPQWRLVQRVVLPTALAGLVTASLLSIARAIGETAPLLLTAFGSTDTNWNVTQGPQSALPLFVWSLIRLPNARQNDRAWTGALILLILVFVLFASARYATSRGRRRLEGRR